MIYGADTNDRDLHTQLRSALHAEKENTRRQLVVEAARLTNNAPPGPKTLSYADWQRILDEERARSNMLRTVAFLVLCAAIGLGAGIALRIWWPVHP